MGYKRKRTIKISFDEGHEFAGLEVRMKTVGVGTLLRLLPLIDRLDFSDLSSEDADQLAGLEESFRQLARIFDSWNIEDEDDTGATVPVPCTYEALMEQDLRLITAVLRAWAEHLAGVPAPLEQPSPDGDPSLEASLPMEVSSPSLAS
jgi:hypothetical protein